MIKERLCAVLEEIKNGNNLGEKIYLVGATKTNDADKINLAAEYGLEIAAENRVQEFLQKKNLVKGVKWHFIGHLQTNKVKYVVGEVEVIHSVDSFKLAEEISKVALKKNTAQKILVEINIGGELSKSGISPLIAEQTVKEISALKGIECAGLMAMLPRTDQTDLQKKLCLQMRELYDRLKGEGFNFQYLSVGMSGDYKTAIKCGSNTIRLGSAIFGERNYEIKG